MVVSCAGTINGGEEILAKTDNVGLQGQQTWEESPKSPNTSWHEDGLGRKTLGKDGRRGQSDGMGMGQSKLK